LDFHKKEKNGRGRKVFSKWDAKRRNQRRKEKKEKGGPKSIQIPREDERSRVENSGKKTNRGEVTRALNRDMDFDLKAGCITIEKARLENGLSLVEGKRVERFLEPGSYVGEKEAQFRKRGMEGGGKIF